jgi:hypothetical protein
MAREGLRHIAMIQGQGQSLGYLPELEEGWCR